MAKAMTVYVCKYYSTGFRDLRKVPKLESLKEAFVCFASMYPFATDCIPTAYRNLGNHKLDVSLCHGVTQNRHVMSVSTIL